MKYFFLVIGLTFLTACSPEDASTTYVKVHKYDGSIQCKDTGIALDVMALELINKGIDVVCSQKGHDGLSRATVCEGDTGNINIYKIFRANLTDAVSAGFVPVSMLSEYRDQACE